MIMVSAWWAVSPGLAAALTAAGWWLHWRTWAAASEDDLEEAYQEGVSDGHLDAMAEALVPLPPVPDPARLPDADTLTAMYAQLGEDSHEEPAPALGPPERLARNGSGRLGVGLPDAVGGLEGVEAAQEDDALALPPEPVTAWDAADEGAERPATIAELAADAEYKLTWRELAGLRASAYDWYDREFATGTQRVIAR